MIKMPNINTPITKYFLALANNIRDRYMEINAKYPPRESVCNNVTKIMEAKPPENNRHLLEEAYIKMPATIANNKIRYPPSVLGSPCLPSKGAVALVNSPTVTNA